MGVNIIILHFMKVIVENVEDYVIVLINGRKKMKITKQSFNFGMKVTKDFNSVSVSEGVECEVDEDDNIDMKLFDMAKEELVERVEILCNKKRETVSMVIPPRKKNIINLDL